jgi:hypothetical protein
MDEPCGAARGAAAALFVFLKAVYLLSGNCNTIKRGKVRFK